MATIPVSHVTEKPGAISFPWVVRCQKCGGEVARLSQEELTQLVMTEEVEPVLCFACERDIINHKPYNPVEKYPQEERSPWPTISVPRSLMGLV